MKIATIIVRVLLGLLFLFASVSYFLKLFPVPDMQGAMKEFNEGVVASGYLMQLVKAIELLVGIALVTGFFVPLATVVIFPISVNIFLVHANIGPEGLPVGIFVLVANLFLAYVYRDKYKALFDIK
jgi:putative oxidoreductase